MSDESKLVSLVVALSGSLKGVAEVVRALRVRSKNSGLAQQTAQELAEALEKCQRDAARAAAELDKELGTDVLMTDEEGVVWRRRE